MADDDNKKYEVDSPSNRSLSTLIDQDLQKESELLQDLIEEVVEANKKVKASHHKRLEDSEEKIRIMNQEIKRLRKAINQKDEETTKAQFDHLLSSKDKIYDALRSMRLRPIETLLEEDHDKTAEGLKERLLKHLERVSEDSGGEHIFMHRFKESAAEFIETAYESGVHATHDETHDTAFNDAVTTFRTSADAFLESMEDVTRTITASLTHRDHILSDGSMDTSLKERVESTYREKKKTLDEKSEALESSMREELNSVDETLESEREAIDSKYREAYKDALEKERKDRETIDEDLKALRLDIIRAEKTNDEETLKDLLETYQKKTSQSEGLVEHKVQRKIEKALAPKRKRLIKQKREIEKTYAKRQAALDRERAELDVQYSGSDELFKVQGDLDAFRSDLTFNDHLSGQLKALTDTFESLTTGVIEFTDAMQRLMIESRVRYLREAAAMTRKLGEAEMAFKASQIDLTRAYRVQAFNEEKTGIRIKSALRRQAITMHFHTRILNTEQSLNDLLKQADIDKTYQQESAQNEKIYQQGLIELADKEYELQLLKVRSLYDNEIALTRAQAERLNVGHDVNEAMVSTTLESQMHFARQQIKYAENEYQVRLENIESALNKELEYAEEKLSSAKQAYRSDIHELRNERDRKLQDLSYRQALFTDPKEKRKLDEQEAKIREHYDRRIKKIEEAEQADDTVQRYQKQIDNANSRAEKAKEDARNLKEKTIGTFKDLLEQSEQKLTQFKSSTGNEEKLGPYIESEASQTAEKRLNEAIDEANRLYKEKVRKPQKKIEKLNETINSIEFDESTRESIDAKRAEVRSIEDGMENALEKEKAQTDMALEEVKNRVKAHEKKVESLKSELSSKDRTHKAERFEKAIETLERHLKQDAQKKRDSFKSTMDNRIKEHHKAMDAFKKSMDDALNPTIRAYGRFTKKASSSQQKALKKARKQVDERLKSSLKDIDNTYDNQL